jgi:hypothetical protein
MVFDYAAQQLRWFGDCTSPIDGTDLPIKHDPFESTLRSWLTKGNRNSSGSLRMHLSLNVYLFCANGQKSFIFLRRFGE